jgi:predicted ATPase
VYALLYGRYVSIVRVMSDFESGRSVGNLPAELTSFVGRRAEIGAVRRLLGEHRLVTLTGAAGVGKTRLAFKVADRLAGRFADSVWLAELAALEDEKFLPHRVADALSESSEALHVHAGRYHMPETLREYGQQRPPSSI